MTYLEVLVEGASDAPVVREILNRTFNLVEGQHFRIHGHKGKGRLPDDVLSPPLPHLRGLLDQLPAKLRGWSYLDESACVVVLIDLDDDSSEALLASLESMLDRLPRRPQRVLFRFAVEETESWFIADVVAVQSAFPKAKTSKLSRIAPDSIVGAWEALAVALAIKVEQVTGETKYEWAEAIAPHLDLSDPRSPSLRAFLSSVATELQVEDRWA